MVKKYLAEGIPDEAAVIRYLFLFMEENTAGRSF
jgi:hypothetical protein